jgi:transcriptional regulator with XRE-family HTH domain
MPTTESPVVARRRVRLALRRFREAKQLTQGQVAEAMEWSLSKVMRIEKGDVSISASDLRVLLDYLDVRDPAEVKQLLADARTSRSERWTVDPDYRDHHTPATVQLLQFEAEATAIRFYTNVLVPGPLQTREYATAVFGNAHDYHLDPAVIGARIEVRMRRREHILDRADPPEYLAILDESVLWRPIGGPQVMGEQLGAMAGVVANAPHAHVRVVPFAAAATIALLGPFTLLDLGGEENAVLHREGYKSDEIVHSPREINRHRDAFEQLWPLALDERASAALIRNRAQAFLAEARGVSTAGDP